MDIEGILNLDPQAIEQLIELMDGLDIDAAALLDAEPDGMWDKERHPDRPRTLADAKAKFTDWESETRFTPEEFDYLVHKIGVPAFFPTQAQRDRSKMFRKVKQQPGDLVFAMMLSRLANPVPVKGQMVNKWGWARDEMTKWINACIDWLVDTWGYLLTLTREAMMTTDAPGGPTRLERYALAVGRKMGMPDPGRCRVFGFLDGTFLDVCRPRLAQDVLYNGYYKGHGLKFQIVYGPDGTVLDASGPESGRHNDIFLWYESGVAEEMDRFPAPPHGGRYLLYGDSAYRKQGASRHIACAFPHTIPLTERQRVYNTMYNRLRVAVEWCFAHIKNLWGFFRDKQRLRHGLSCVGRQYLAAVLLYNFRTMIHGRNQTTDYFRCRPPRLDQYLATPRPARSRDQAVWDEYMELVADYGRLGLPLPE